MKLDRKDRAALTLVVTMAALALVSLLLGAVALGAAIRLFFLVSGL